MERRDESPTGRTGAAPALDALRRIEMPSAASRFDRLAVLVRESFATAAAAVSLAEGAQVALRSVAGLPDDWRLASPLARDFCARVISSNDVVAISDLSEEESAAALCAAGVTAYLGVPIRRGETPIGALAVLDDRRRLWTSTEIRRLGDFAAVIESEIELQDIARERDLALREAELLAHEHSHRVKNSLAVAASLVTLSGAEATTPADVVRIARDRIAALSAAQNLRRQGAVDELGSLLGAVLGPYGGGGERVRITGRPIRLPDEKVTPLSLIFHELATNACKYGGLSDVGGTIELDWRSAGDRLEIAWRERLPAAGVAATGLRGDDKAGDGKEEGKGDGSGFGSRLVDLCVRQLAAEMRIDSGPDGGREIVLAMPWPQAGVGR